MPASDQSSVIEALKRPLAELPDPLPLPAPPASTPAVSFRPPGSKSLTNRALLLGALASGKTKLHGALLGADDTERMIEALTTLGARVSVDDEVVSVEGVGGRWKTDPGGVTVNLKNAGTATRFLTAAALLAPGPVTIDGNERMRQRPIGELAETLRSLGAGVDHLMEPGCPPVRVTPPAEPSRPLSVTLRGKLKSSQFVSALLLTGPFLPGGITVRLEREPPSAGYIEMTVDLLEAAGALVQHAEDLRVIRVMSPAVEARGPSGKGLDAFELEIEPDASGATYWWGAAALSPGRAVTVLGLDEDSLQSDAGFARLLARMGPEVHVNAEGIVCEGRRTLDAVLADLTRMPDAAMTLGAVCAFAKGNSVIRGLETLRVKETDRIAAMRSELAKIGVTVENPVAGDAGAITVTPPDGGVDCSDAAPPVEFDTYDDHRMAMSMALVALRRPNVLIRDPGCVAKTYPTFWAEFARLFE